MYHADSIQAGGVIGIIALAHVNDRWGRRVAMWTCAGLGLVGGTFLCAAQNVGMFIAFRFFAGAGAWSFLSISE
jgi:MFS family permease